MLGHSTFVEYLESIVAHGLRPEGVHGNIARKYDKGWVSFERDPPTDWLTRNLHRLKSDPPSCRTFALEFDEARIRDEFEVKELRREVVNDLCPAFFPTEAAVLQHVGITVKVKPESGSGVSIEYLTGEYKCRLREMGYRVG